MYLPNLTANVNNWPVKHRGKILNFLQSPTQIAPIILSALYYSIFARSTDLCVDDLQGFFLCLCCMLGSFSLISVAFTREYSYIDLNDNNDGGVGTIKTKDNEKTQIIQQHPDNVRKKKYDENRHLIVQNVICDKTRLDSIIGGVKCIDTQVVFWAQGITPIAGLVMLNNITSMLQSSGYIHLSFAYTTAGPLTALIIRSTTMYISDRCIHKISRVGISLILSAVSLISLIPCIWLGGSIVILSIAYFSTISSAETNFLLLPLFLAERFDASLFGNVYTCAILLPCILNAIVQPIIGYMYDMQVSAGDSECVGFKCFQMIFVVLFLTQLAGTGLHILHVLRQLLICPGVEKKRNYLN